MCFIVCVIKNTEGLFYKGVTSDLEKRLRYHNSSLSRWIKNRDEWSLVYSKTYDTKTMALKQERFLKSDKGREFLK